MQSLVPFLAIISILLCKVYGVPPVHNYAGQVAVNGEAFDGNGLFKFALVNTDGNVTYWSNDGTSVDGSEPQASVAVPVNGGLYAVLLGNTAQQGMGAIDPAVFAQHIDAKLRVWFSDGVNGFQQLSPDRPFASVPYAFSAGTAQTAGSAPIANGAVNLDMLSQDVKSQINAPIGLNRLSSEVTAKLDQNGTGGSGVVAGSLISVPYGQSAPAGYSHNQRGEPKELVWEEKAPVSVARQIRDGAAVLDGKIYVVGGSDQTKKDLFERYDPNTNTWHTLSPISSPRNSSAVSSLQGKLYAIGGYDDNGRLATVEIFDPTNDSWTQGPSLPHAVYSGSSISHGESIYLIGGNDPDSKIATNYMLEANSSAWVAKAPMSIARASQRLVIYEDRIWAMGGNDADSGENALNLVESYDPVSDSWQTEPTLPEKIHWASAWVANGKIYIAGGRSANDVFESSIHSFSREAGWISAGNLTENKSMADAVVLNNKAYVIAGQTASGIYSNKVFAADLNASVAGVYDLYRKDGNAPAGTPLVQAEVPDGSVTTAKLASNTITTSDLSEQILKYLKPEITSEPQAQTVFADSNVSYSVSAEGKYLTYQWKKDGSDLTGENNSTLTITDANATLHDGNYSVVVSNDFGSVESDLVEVSVKDSLLDGLVGWWKFDETSGTVAHDSSGNGNDGNLTNGPTWVGGKIGGALSFDGVDDFVQLVRGDVVGSGLHLSISVWIKPSAGPTGAIFGEYGKNSSNQYQ
ncbi:MAG: kelch repeat-containing protein, partial [Verrucomicrobiota bacterium]|nr:kelch repeat-containing protein [Verrucomicrobiota bacterium]